MQLLSLLSVLSVMAFSWLPAAAVRAVEPASDLAAYVDLHVTRPGAEKSSIVCTNAPRIVAAAPYLEP